MDVRDQGLSILWLRILARGNPGQRLRMNKYYEQWIDQVKFSEQALIEAGLDVNGDDLDDRLV